MESLSPSPTSSTGFDAGLDNLDSAFEFQLGLDNARASTPKPDGGHINGTSSPAGHTCLLRQEIVVLRIDNVPWDITPPQIQNWLQQPLERIHVLLDKKGKTMSHAYVEVADIAVAGGILRGEIRDVNGARRPGGKAKERGSVLGKGRRARGVTVTKSSQEELMANLFPNWRGCFDGPRPSLAGLANDRVTHALEGGLICEADIVALLHLVKEPDSHFLKVPCLPFYSLVSLLSKFPSDVDSRVFWNAGTRDILFDVVYGTIGVLNISSPQVLTVSTAALQVLLPRVKTDGAADQGYTDQLVSDLVVKTFSCKIFTTQQITKFGDLVKSLSLPLPANLEELTAPSPLSPRSSAKAPGHSDLFVSNEILHSTMSAMQHVGREQSLAGLAQEFGVQPQLIKALAQRLSGIC